MPAIDLVKLTPGTLDHLRVDGTLTLEAGEASAVVGLTPMIFSSGADGYFASGAIVLEGVRYQMTCSIVRAGSKGAHPQEAAAIIAARAERERLQAARARQQVEEYERKNGKLVIAQPGKGKSDKAA